MTELYQLKPEKVFAYFERICSVPHGSGNMKQISDLCVHFAQELKLKYRQDEVYNVVIWKDASAGYESAEPIILQGHIDMVCAKTQDCTKDMTKEGIDVLTNGQYVWADKTSLGGDNGIAVAMIFAILSDNDLPHPAIEAVLTVDEETGMDGAIALDCSDLKGRKLINIDSEKEGVFTVSCAGGVCLSCFLPGEQRPLSGEIGYDVTITGLCGGHSGVEIDKGRASANHLMGRVLFMAAEQIEGLRVADIRGGQAANVICPMNTAKVAVPAADCATFEALLAELEAVLKNEYAFGDAGLKLQYEKTSLTEALDRETTGEMLYVLFALPQGVQEMSMELPGQVQTSLNLGTIAVEKDGLHFTYSIRSSIASQKNKLKKLLHMIVEKAGGSICGSGDYPGWQFAKESDLRDTVLAAYREISGKEGVITATHGGIECGLFSEKLPGLDAISMGPDLIDIHSVNERLDVASTARVYELLCEILRRSISAEAATTI